MVCEIVLNLRLSPKWKQKQPKVERAKEKKKLHVCTEKNRLINVICFGGKLN